MTQVQLVRGPIVEAPTPERRRGDLLDVADVREGMAWIDPNDMFVSWNCLEAGWVDVCAADSTPSKTFGSPTVVDGVRFAVYLGGQCKPLTDDTEANIGRVFDLRESRAVEKRFETLVLGLGTAVTGSPVSAAHALAMMENALGDQYAGVGTIHMSPLMATLLLQDMLLVDSGGRFTTHLGTKVVVGTGYSSTALYGTGDVTLYRSAQVLVDSPDMAQNVNNVLAERAYVAVADCVALKMTGVPMPTAGGASGPTPTPQTPVNVVTGVDTVEGPAGSWTPPSGSIRNVTVVVTSGSVEVDGDEVTAPYTVSFDADEDEVLTPPTVTADDDNDRCVVTWVVVP
jgi:hypothetical protein